MSDVLIPLDNSPMQSFDLPLRVDGDLVAVHVVLRYNEAAKYWTMSVSDQTGVLLVDSVPFVTGDWHAANILGQFAYLRIGAAYVINASNLSRLDFPDAETLGSDFVLIWGDTPL